MRYKFKIISNGGNFLTYADMASPHYFWRSSLNLHNPWNINNHRFLDNQIAFHVVVFYYFPFVL